jgi:hypothetical protein
MGKMQDLVDRGFMLDQRIKKAEKELDGIKRDIKKYGKERDDPVVEGLKSVAMLTDMGWSSIDAYKLYNWLEEQERETEFFDLVKPKVAEVKKAIGETAFGRIGKTGTLTYHKIQFKRR